MTSDKIRTLCGRLGGATRRKGDSTVGDTGNLALEIAIRRKNPREKRKPPRKPKAINRGWKKENWNPSVRKEGKRCLRGLAQRPTGLEDAGPREGQLEAWRLLPQKVIGRGERTKKCTERESSPKN